MPKHVFVVSTHLARFRGTSHKCLEAGFDKCLDLIICLDDRRLVKIDAVSGVVSDSLAMLCSY